MSSSPACESNALTHFSPNAFPELVQVGFVLRPEPPKSLDGHTSSRLKRAYKKRFLAQFSAASEF